MSRESSKVTKAKLHYANTENKKVKAKAKIKLPDNKNSYYPFLPCRLIISVSAYDLVLFSIVYGL